MPRARHHFHAPIANPGVTPPNPNSGLNNQTDHPGWAEFFDSWTDYFYNLHFDLTGASAQKRALGIEGAEWETEYLNYFAWPDSRTYFYRALTKSNLAARSHYLALTFISLGQTAHLLEDMGVPAHARNDFVYGHMRLRGINIIKDWGNPFEHWTEKQVKANNNTIPSSWLTGWTPQPKLFDKIAKYWDTDSNTIPYIGLPSSAWGLAEQTNYQFYSTSTGPGCTGTLYQFPNPAESHTTPLTEGNRRYFSGYGVQHLSRETYTYYASYTYGYGTPAIMLAKKTITPDDDTNVYNDYVRVTIPRTIDYASGLLNYFFRGRLSVGPNCANAECDPIEIYITNQSVNTNVNQTLKGGIFELYWDDNVGNRTAVSGLTVYDSNDPNRTVLWGTSTTLPKGNSVRARFNKPSLSNIAKYILVYRGAINANPNNPDLDDPNAIAVCEFAPPNPPQPHITNITPEMGHPGSILFIEGSGFSKTPLHNTVLFDDVNTAHPNVYGTVTEADSNGRWLKVELPYFEAEDEDYYWADTTVMADGNTSNPYAFKLTNYIWCTITIWDAGVSIDDEFDLYVNDEYITTSYMDPPEDPTVVEYGFWYENVYDFVDIYLYESYEVSGGTLGIIIEPYVNRVIAYRWNDGTQSQEFLYDEDFSGIFTDVFGSSVLVDPGDGAELDVYTWITYISDMGLSKMIPIKPLKEESTVGAGRILERLGQFDSVRVAENKQRPDVPRKRARKITDLQRTRKK
jgi:hypothetical protein